MSNVGAGIISIITESLYDKPIVVFREYVQNSVDSIKNSIDESFHAKDAICNILYEDNNIYILDNGNGINKMDFLQEMKSIAYSQKKRKTNIGYKGIGRLSGMSYCDKLIFVNICDYDEKKYQIYEVDCKKFNTKKDEEIGTMSFEALMDDIGEFYDINDQYQGINNINEILEKQEDILKVRNKGFFVILQNINSVLQQTIRDKKFIEKLGWLLPVDFKKEMYEENVQAHDLFLELKEKNNNIVPAEGFRIYYNKKEIRRPIEPKMLRKYVSRFDMGYAIGFVSFNNDKIIIEKGNGFSGIRVYIDNMLLCDETELLAMLIQYGMIDHTYNELIQTVRGVGVFIYITDKINITANARRTFIEITDNDALEFLRKVSVLIEKIYNVRYTLSAHNSAKVKYGIDSREYKNTVEAANIALRELSEEDIIVPEVEGKSFGDYSTQEQKQIVKKRIVKEMNKYIKEYLEEVTVLNYDSAIDDFTTWLLKLK